MKSMKALDATPSVYVYEGVPKLRQK